VWREVYEKNAMAAIECTMQVLPKMIENKWGRVITISSVLGYEGGGRPWFNMAKSAEKSLMKTLSLNKRYATKNITFNTIAPGPVKIPDTGWDKFEKENPEEFKKIIDKLPAERFIIPEEIATLVTFLSSDRASGISGQHIRVDCGQTKSF